MKITPHPNPPPYPPKGGRGYFQVSPWPTGLQALARSYGVQRSYYGLGRSRHEASPDVVLAVLRALGAGVKGPGDIPAALRTRRQDRWDQLVEPVVVAWGGEPANVVVRLPRSQADSWLECSLALDPDGERSWTVQANQLPTVDGIELDGAWYECKLLPVPGALPRGYHRLGVRIGGREATSLLISAPARAWTPSPAGRAWGLFMPLHALYSERSWGAGDLGDLGRLAQWTAGLGGRVVATLPLLASSLQGDAADPSPYAPVSRLFWNEFYLDLDQVLVSRPAGTGGRLDHRVAQALAALRAEALVDYSGAMALKRAALAALAEEFFRQPARRPQGFERLLETNPALERYARFRAVWEKLGVPWQRWPERLRRGDVRAGDYDERVERYHLYAQWQAEEQLRAVADAAKLEGVTLCFDLPIGSRRDGFDVWSEQGLFAQGLSVGAPPDPGCPAGQDWSLPPIRPDQSRAQEHRYFIASLRHQLRQAGMLRLDHVIGLHRLYCIPEGADKLEGVYVRYPWEEYYAILTLESHRHQALIVGEDLGTVARPVRRAMSAHGLHRTYVLQSSLVEAGSARVASPPAASVATLNTHDMPPFAGFWEGEARQEVWRRLVALLRSRGLVQEGEPDLNAVLAACLRWLGASRAQVVLVNLEDLWLEIEPQNVPGSPRDVPNWRRKARYAIDNLGTLEEVESALSALNAARGAGSG